MEIFPSLFLNLLTASLLFASVLGADVYSEALLSLKSQLVDDYNSLNDWFFPSKENPSEEIAACAWSGVTCSSNSTMVVGLDLSKRGLAGSLSGGHFNVFVDLVNLNLSYNLFSGQLPTEIFNVTNLKSLDLSRNNFSGYFPNGVSGLKKLVVLNAFSNSFSGPLPAEVSEIESLKVLNFAGSYFSGPIPAEFGSFKSLELIHLAGNFLGGPIPPELGRLQTVIHMEIGYNTYSGGIPWQLGNMSSLQYLDIAGANLSGPIPKELSNLTKLESLFLFRNQFSGLIPLEFSNLVSLRSLDLSDNRISGPIPESFAELKELRLLSLMFNEMNGTLPKAMADLPMLETLLIWSNFFSGPLPENLGMSPNLKSVDVSTNKFNGSIPADICAGGMLSKLILFSNEFTGELPLSLSNCSSLVRLRVEDNLLSGHISLNFSHLSDVSYIDLSRNKFTGGIPVEISEGFKLEYFNVSYNPELGGNLPPKLWSLPLLQNFSASSCNISGNLPAFESCKSLNVVELISNSLSGTLPETISDCHGLSAIDLSHNNLTGHIPEKLGHSSSLILLNVSFNDISGSIPQEKIFRLMDRSAFAGNPRLCGAPLQRCPGSKAVQTEFFWVLILCVSVVTFVAFAVSGIFYLQKGRKGQWKMISFSGLPQFTASDVLKSFNSKECMETVPSLSSPICKAVLPTGITVLVKKIEWEPKKMNMMAEFINQMGYIRHKNLTRLLGYCYNRNLAYLLYDHVPSGNLAEKIRLKRDWASKYEAVISIAKGLCFLHHDCYPGLPHGDVRTSNIVFDENMEPQLAEFGFKFLVRLSRGPFLLTHSIAQTGEFNSVIEEELYSDIYNFGEVVLEILTNGRIINGGKSMQNKTRDVLLEEILTENQVGSPSSSQEEVKLALEVALLCTKDKQADRPSMADALKLLSGANGQ